MADGQPFAGLRYDPAYDPAAAGDWGAVLGPPYDILSPAQRQALLERSPLQITHIESAATAEQQTAAAARLRDWRRTGVLIRESQPAYYLAEHRFLHGGAARSRLSLYAAVRLTPWEAGQVRPHEWTMAGPKVERLALLDAVRANISPVFALVPDRSGALGEALEAALRLPVTADGVDANGDRHILRVVRTPALLDRIRTALAADTLYIADGHHRYESALEYRNRRAAAAGGGWPEDAPENFVLMGLVRAADPGLIVGPTHRIIRRAAIPGDLLRAAGRFFEVSAVGARADGVQALLQRLAAQAGAGPAIGAVGLDGEHVHLLHPTARVHAAFPPRVPASWTALDVAILQYGLLQPLLGIDDAALTAGGAVAYTHDPAEAWRAVTEEGAPLAFFLNAPTLDQIFAAADAGDRMPQKSTYFTPKLPTGVVLYPFD